MAEQCRIQISDDTAEALGELLGDRVDEAIERILQLGIEAVRSMSKAELRAYFEERWGLTTSTAGA